MSHPMPDDVRLLMAELENVMECANESHAPGERGVRARLALLAACDSAGRAMMRVRSHYDHAGSVEARS